MHIEVCMYIVVLSLLGHFQFFRILILLHLSLITLINVLVTPLLDKYTILLLYVCIHICGTILNQYSIDLNCSCNFVLYK